MQLFRAPAAPALRGGKPLLAADTPDGAGKSSFDAASVVAEAEARMKAWELSQIEGSRAGDPSGGRGADAPQASVEKEAPRVPDRWKNDPNQWKRAEPPAPRGGKTIRRAEPPAPRGGKTILSAAGTPDGAGKSSFDAAAVVAEAEARMKAWELSQIEGSRAGDPSGGRSADELGGVQWLMHALGWETADHREAEE